MLRSSDDQGRAIRPGKLSTYALICFCLIGLFLFFGSRSQAATLGFGHARRSPLLTTAEAKARIFRTEPMATIFRCRRINRVRINCRITLSLEVEAYGQVSPTTVPVWAAVYRHGWRWALYQDELSDN